MPFDADSVIREYAPFVWRVLLHLGVPESQLEDVSQEVLMVICRKLATFEARSSLRTWIYGICRNTAKVAVRQHAEQREVLGMDLHEQAEPAPQDRTLWLKQAHAELVHVLSTLDEEQRTVFVLYEIEDVSMEEIACLLGAPLTTCYSRLHIARSKIELAMRRRKRQRMRIVSGGFR